MFFFIFCMVALRTQWTATLEKHASRQNASSCCTADAVFGPCLYIWFMFLFLLYLQQCVNLHHICGASVIKYHY